MWDERYAEPGFIYGEEPNEFLASIADRIPPGPVLCLGDGEGRNGVFLAGLGHRVIAVDQSAVGLAKAQQLAASRGVESRRCRRTSPTSRSSRTAWAGIISIFCHLPSEIRVPLHRAAVAGLRPGGVFVLEGYTPAQIGRGTGGPEKADMMPTLAGLQVELSGLKFDHALELERDIVEGRYHTGFAAVVQVVASRVA